MTAAVTILVIDDDPHVRETLADILRLKGYTAVTAASGETGIAAARQAPAKVVLVDLHLPDMSGIEAMEAIQADTPATETIILTGHASLDTALEATRKGAFSYLLKPYDVDKLVRHVQRALERQQAQQEITRLASFPGLNPNPVLEVDADGNLTYLNPAAARLLPPLAVGRPVRDALGDLSTVLARNDRRERVREFRVGKATFEQHFFPVPGSDLTRIYMTEITERKAHETELERLNQLLLIIRSINEYLLVAQNEEALYRFVCEALKRLDDVIGVVIATESEDFTLQPIAWAGLSDETVASVRARWDASVMGSGVMGAVVRDGKAVVANDVETDPRYEPWREMTRAWNIRAAAGAPLLASGEAYGALVVYSSRKDAFDAQITEFIAEIAGDIAVGVRSLRLDKNLHATLDHLRRSMNSTVEAIATMVELRDPYTAGHERRVAQLAHAIGEAMGLPERQVEGVRVIGHLHDIGKIAVPAEILSKPTRLSDIEYAMVRSHAQSGYEILKNLEFPWPVAQAVLQHHERLDGSGYPQGLAGDDIILEARILMVADVVEAMASHRPYRTAIGSQEALAEIAANRGKLYDAQVVDTCLRLFADDGFKFDGVP